MDDSTLELIVLIIMIAVRIYLDSDVFFYNKLYEYLAFRIFMTVNKIVVIFLYVLPIGMIIVEGIIFTITGLYYVLKFILFGLLNGNGNEVLFVLGGSLVLLIAYIEKNVLFFFGEISKIKFNSLYEFYISVKELFEVFFTWIQADVTAHQNIIRKEHSIAEWFYSYLDIYVDYIKYIFDLFCAYNLHWVFILVMLFFLIKAIYNYFKK